MASGLRKVRGPTLGKISQALRALPIKIAEGVARDAAPAITALAGTAFDAGRDVYGGARPRREDGAPMTLKRSGALRSDVKFTFTGTIVRCVLGPSYAKYLIRYGYLPNGKAAIPVAWQAKLREIAARHVAQAAGGAA